MDGRADMNDMMADAYNAIKDAELDVYRQGVRERLAKKYGILTRLMKPNDSRIQLVKWIRQSGAIDNTIPLCGGKMRTLQSLITVDGEEYYTKWGWFMFEGKTLRTLTPDQTIQAIVKRSVSYEQIRA